MDGTVKVPFEVKKGDRVTVPFGRGTEVKVECKEQACAEQDDILAIIE